MNADRIVRNITDTAGDAERALTDLIRAATEALDSLRGGQRISASISGDPYFAGDATKAAYRLVKLQAQIDMAIMAGLSPAAVQAASTAAFNN